MSEHRLPRRDSGIHRALGVLLELGDGATPEEWREAFDGGLTAHQFHQGVIEVLVRHRMARRDGGYGVTDIGRAMLGLPPLAVPVSCGELAQPRVAPSFRPLRRGNRGPSIIRAGAFDYRDTPSLMGGQRVPYRSDAAAPR
ncbi:hypothetical protein IP92_00503 [Pseudoduganella flava]|uniref:Uncharacterized protein n=1 Tax=Pseudoduganella flava TaxID=871742 RepID=A0A562Q651_9BURK|nr:hypothetical protein [Pseudoduganella flava]QGZ41542.1 hypothetical protein GO485_22455 [Pseudoduganella flava]TWI51516.1 hypothetical protein IP92_00503 [Pseudoduganella flava]